MYVDLNRVLHYFIALTWGALLAVFVYNLTVSEMEGAIIEAHAETLRAQLLLDEALVGQAELLHLVNETLGIPRPSTTSRTGPRIGSSTARGF